MSGLSNFMIRYRWVVVIAVLLITAFFSFELRKIKVDSNIINSLPQDDSIVKSFKEVGEKYGGNEMGVIIIEAPNVLMPKALDEIQMLSDTLAEIQGISSVTSITNMMVVNASGDDFQVDNLINQKNRPSNKEEAKKLQEELNQNEMVSGSLIAKDAGSTLIVYTYENNADIDATTALVMQKIKELNLNEKYYFAGSPFIRQYVSKVVSHDLKTLIPLAFVIIAFLLYFSFHSFRGILLPLLTAGLAIIWAMGVFALFGINLSMVSNNVPIIVLAVGTAYAIHLLNRVNQCNETDKKKAITKALSFMIVPISLTALTTMVGFLSFIFGSYLNLIRDFGILAALGTFFSAVIALTLVPALLSILPAKKGKEGGKILSGHKNSLLTPYFLAPLSKKVLNHPKRIIVVWLVIFILSLGGIMQLKRSVSVAGYFKKNHPVSLSEKIMSEKYGGSKPVYVIFKGDVQSPEFLKAMDELEAYMNKSPHISGTQSVADVVKKLNKAMGGEDKIPDSEATIGQLWFLLGQQESINRLVAPNLDEAIILAKFADEGDNAINDFNDYMQKYLDTHQSDAYTIEITGMPFVNARLSDSLLKSQIMSLIIALILVVAIVSLMLRSLIKGLYAASPITVTIGIIYGIMGITGIPLNIATVLVASIAIGIGIDYSIHFVSHFNHLFKEYGNVAKAIEETILVSGNAIIINFVSVSAGFFTLVFSDMVPMIYFGIIIALSMLGASMGALTLLPSILLFKEKS